jgi:HPt (histidine-containing phosphotransfer) domain-containing protein
MQRPKIDKPSVATYADHEVITPPNKLRRAMSTAAKPADNPVARAEQALAGLSDQFAAWMEAECERLDQARNAIKALGFTKPGRDKLFLAAHDIRGEAETLGYPSAAAPAGSLCRLIEHTPDMNRIPMALVDQHVDAVRAIIRESARPDMADVAAALTRRLRQVTDEFLANENRDRLDELKDILAPTLAPGDPAF